jgi:hypothetical protein
MVCHKLAVEKRKPAISHTGHKGCKRHFGCICHAREHAFPKKGAAHGQAVKAANQFVIHPAFYTMRHAALMKLQKSIFYIAVDPCFIAAGGHFSTFPDNLWKGCVACQNKPVLPYCFCKGLGQMEIFQR